LSCVKPVVQPSQEVVLIPATASLDVWQYGSSPMRTYYAGGPFFLLPSIQLGAQIPPEGVLVTTTTSFDVWQARSPSARSSIAGGPVAQSFAAVGSSLGVSRVIAYDFVRGFKAEFEFKLGESYSTSVVPDSGDKLVSQDKVEFAALVPLNVSPWLLSALASSQEGDQILEEEGRADTLCLGDEFDRDGEEGRAGTLCLGNEIDRDGERVLLSLLGSYSPCSVGELELQLGCAACKGDLFHCGDLV
jgi:hypothetical protein